MKKTIEKVKKEDKSSIQSGIPAPPARPARGPSPNKMTPPDPSSTASSSATPIPPATPPPNPKAAAVPKQPPYPPRKPRHAGYDHPTPPPAPGPRYPTPPRAPRRDHERTSDTTDDRDPLPRRRQEVQEETRRPDFDFQFNEYADLDAYIELMHSIAESAPDPATARARRIQIWDRILELVERGISTGSKMLDRMLLQGRDAVQTSENVYYLPYVPTPEQHFLCQDPGEAGMIFGPNLMVHITDEQYSIQVLEDLVELGRNVLAGRAVLRDHPLNTSQEYFNVSTFYLTVVVLNLGNIRRMPWFANRKKFPREIRDVQEELRQRLVLPYLIVNNPGHIITLCESYDFSIHHDLCFEYNVIGIQVRSDKRLCSPPVAVFVKSQCGLVEIMHHGDECKEKESHIDEFWVIHVASLDRRHMTSMKAHANAPNTDTPVNQFTDLLLLEKVAAMSLDARILSLLKISWTELRPMKRSLMHPITLQWVYPRALCSDWVWLKFEF